MFALRFRFVGLISFLCNWKFIGILPALLLSLFFGGSAMAYDFTPTSLQTFTPTEAESVTRTFTLRNFNDFSGPGEVQWIDGAGRPGGSVTSPTFMAQNPQASFLISQPNCNELFTGDSCDVTITWSIAPGFLMPPFTFRFGYVIDQFGDPTIFAEGEITNNILDDAQAITVSELSDSFPDVYDVSSQTYNFELSTDDVFATAAAVPSPIAVGNCSFLRDGLLVPSTVTSNCPDSLFQGASCNVSITVENPTPGSLFDGTYTCEYNWAEPILRGNGGSLTQFGGNVETVLSFEQPEYSVVEGSTDTPGTVTLFIASDRPLREPRQVDVGLGGGSAQLGSDFSAPFSEGNRIVPVLIPEGVSRFPFEINLVGDAEAEPVEDFFLIMDGRNQNSGTRVVITDDDSELPAVRGNIVVAPLSDVTGNEDEIGSFDVAITRSINPDAETAAPATIGFSIAGAIPLESDTENYFVNEMMVTSSDASFVSSGAGFTPGGIFSLSWDAGEVDTKIVTFSVIADSNPEVNTSTDLDVVFTAYDEFTINPDGSSSGSNPQQLGRFNLFIVDDDEVTPPVISVFPSVTDFIDILEGDESNPGVLPVSVSAADPVEREVRVLFRTGLVGPESAADETDFVDNFMAEIVIPVGDTFAEAELDVIIGDDEPEMEEVFDLFVDVFFGDERIISYDNIIGITDDDLLIPSILVVSPTSLTWPSTVQTGEISDASFQISLENTLDTNITGGQSVEQVVFGDIGPLSVLDTVNCSNTLEPGDIQSCELNLSLDATGGLLEESYELPISYFNGQETVTTSIAVNVNAVNPGQVQFTESEFSFNEADGTVEVLVERINGSDGVLSVDYAFTAIAPTNSDDFADVTTNAGTLIFNSADSNTQAISIALSDDELVEPTESFTITLSNPTLDDGTVLGAELLGGVTEATVSIVDDDDPTISTLVITPQSLAWPTTVVVGEGSTADFLINLGNAASESGLGAEISAVSFAGTSLLQILNEDCPVSLPANESESCTLSLQLGPQLDVGPISEVITVSYFNGESTVTTSINVVATAVLPVSDIVSLASATGSVNEGSALQLAVVRTQGNVESDPSFIGTSTDDVGLVAGMAAVNFSVIAAPGSTAEAGVDFVEITSGVLEWPIGDTGDRTIVVEALEDNAFGEGVEQLSVILSNPVGLVLGLAEATIDIIDLTNPGELSLSPEFITVNEGDTDVSFTVTRSQPSEGPISVNFRTADGTATAGQDYVAVEGTLNFADGQNSQSFSVPIISSADVGDEQFTVEIFGAEQGVAIASSQSVVTIEDTTVPSVFSFVSNTFTVEESSQVGIPVIRTTTVGSATVGFSISGSASADDFELLSPTDGVLRFEEGQAQQTIEILVLGDNALESSETISISLSNASAGASVNGDANAVITIEDTSDTGQVLFSQDSYSVDENSGVATITVSRVPNGSGSVAGGAVVNFSVVEGSATDGADFTATSGSVQWSDGETGNRTFQIPIIEDELIEGTENLSITLSNSQPDSVLLDSPATLNIIDTSSAETVVLSHAGELSLTVEEGSTVSIPIVRDGDTQSRVTLSYEVGGEGSSASSADYTLRTGDLVWEPGVTGEQNIVIDVNQDELVESNEETLVVRFTQATAEWSGNLIDPPSVPLVTVPQTDVIVSIIDDEDRPLRNDDGTPIAPVYIVQIESGNNQNPTVVPSTLEEPLSVRILDPTGDNQAVPSIEVVWEIVPDPRVATTAPVAEFVENSGQTLVTTTDASGVSQIQVRVLRRGFIGVRVTPQINLPVTQAETLSKRTIQAVAPVFRLQDGAALFNILVGRLQPAALTESEFEVATAIDLACDAIDNAEVVLLTQEEQNFGALCELEGESDENIRQALDRLATEETFTLGDSVLSLSNIQITNVYARINAIRSGKSNPVDASGLRLRVLGDDLPGAVPEAIVNLFASGGSGGTDDLGLISDWGFFINGSAVFGEADGTINEIGQNFDTRGITAGADYRLRSNLIFGGALGFTNHKSRFSTGGGESNQDGQYLSLFGTWFDENAGYLDGIIEVGRNTFDIRRRIDLGFSEEGTVTTALLGDGGDKFANGDTSASSIAMTVSAGYDFNVKGWSIGSYGRFSVTAAEIDDYSEQVSDPTDISSGWALDVGSHRVLSNQLSIGGQLSKTFNTKYGVFVPQLRIEGQVELENRPDGITARFQNDPLETAFTIQADDNESTVFNYGFGSSAVFPRGRSAFLFYEGQAGNDRLSIHNLKGGFRVEF